ncbi:MAG: PilZ domain-containing protein [Tepidanaerobacteraceae bacterium]|jgi:c-di-GMP-binding flagellar brake protein YcgR|nr:PilZ domain-containing protein [Tepidanaerobacteraceae bacterium]
MDFSGFRIGMKINIEIERGKENFYFTSKVEDIESGALVLDIPMKDNRLFHVSLNESVKIHFSKGDSFYYFIGEIVAKKYIPIPVLFVKPISPLIKNQRRDFFRIKITLKTKISLAESCESFDGYIKDLSGGGALITTDRELKSGTLLNLQVSLMSNYFNIKGRVVRSWCEKQPGQPIVHYAAAQFVDIDKVVQDEIIKFIFAEQRKMIRKGYQ